MPSGLTATPLGMAGRLMSETAPLAGLITAMYGVVRWAVVPVKYAPTLAA